LNRKYTAIISSDWSECLAPSGPFDFMAFTYPQLAPALTRIFQDYTGNRMTLAEAAVKIQKLLPAPITPEQMDAYLQKSFVTYTGVPDLIAWCRSKGILFMINTTGMIGYFQRVFAAGLLPEIAVLSANPLIRYPQAKSDPQSMYDLHETGDKAKNTAAVVRSLNLPPEKIVLMGDSGGDGPHFKWGAEIGAFLIASMTKPSLDRYCRENNIHIHVRFGRDYSRNGQRDLQTELQVNFMDLVPVIEDIIEG